MILKRISGLIQSNCYIAGDSGHGLVIDPGADAGKILREAEEAGLLIKGIIITHVHYDHIVSMDEIRDATGAPVMVHELEADYPGNALYNGSQLFGCAKSFRNPDRLLKDGDIIKCGGIDFKILHTPGHSPGSICILANECIFTGDTLFRMSVGRTDLGNGNYPDLENSLKNVLMRLPDETVVYPGHGVKSTIGYERNNNPYI